VTNVRAWRKEFAFRQWNPGSEEMPTNDHTILVVEDSSDDAALIRVAFHKAVSIT
jgi:hypothetical protein